MAFTLCLEHPSPFFTNTEIVRIMVEFLAKSAKRHNFNAVFCFMPQHAHLIFMGKLQNSDLLAGMCTFKQATGHWLRHHAPSVTWQESFYDHIIRVHEDLRAQVRYLVNNPVRLGLVNDWREYRFTGAIGINLEEFLFEVSIS